MGVDGVFDERSEKVTFGTSKLSFEECPNGCVDGYFIDPYTHKKRKCIYCQNKRRSMVKDSLVVEDSGSDIRSLLNVPDSFVGDVLNVETVIPEFARKSIKLETIGVVFNLLEELYKDASVGVPADTSILFNLGKRAFENNFVYPYLLRAYQAGLGVAPYLTDYDVVRLFANEPCTIKDLTLQDVLKQDVCVVTILSSASKESILGVKGLMTFRANFDRSTIIFTKSWVGYIHDLCTEDGFLSKSLAYLATVEYESTVGVVKQPGVGITSEQYKRMISP